MSYGLGISDVFRWALLNLVTFPTPFNNVLWTPKPIWPFCGGGSGQIAWKALLCPAH